MPETDVNHFSRIPRPTLRLDQASEKNKRIALAEIISRIKKQIQEEDGYRYRLALNELFHIADRVNMAQTEGELQDLLRKLGAIR